MLFDRELLEEYAVSSLPNIFEKYVLYILHLNKIEIYKLNN